MKININGEWMDVAVGATILQAAQEKNIRIPTLCFMNQINRISSCRVCMVEADGRLVPACSTVVREGMMIITDSERVHRARQKNLELICSDHVMECTECPRGADCELRELCKEYEVNDRAYGLGKRAAIIDNSSPYLIRDNSKCILCRRCEAVCKKLQGVGALKANKKGGQTNMGFELPLSETNCVGCGQCAAVCPTGAIAPKDNTKTAWKAILDKEKYVVAAVSPNAYLRIGEFFGEAPGTDCGGKVAAILRKIGIDAVYDLSHFEADFREAQWKLAEQECKEKGRTVFSAECPAWRNYVERFLPEISSQLLPECSCAEMLARRCKEERDLFFISIDSCSAAKGSTDGVDVSLTTRELFYLIQRACVSSFTAHRIWRDLKEEPFDYLSENYPENKFEIRDALSEETRNGFKIATVTGLENARSIMKHVQQYDCIHVLACPGGCLNGGGMPALYLEKARMNQE
ncbi:MAG: [Fe-Fe] hydrogenase large subunit C-terminal domain-containing protein [Faecousia sp.]